MDQRLRRFLAAGQLGAIDAVDPVSGGDINEAFRLHTSSGTTLFMKYQGTPPRGMFEAEAVGLRALHAAFEKAATDCSLRIPEVLSVQEDYLLLEDLTPSPRIEGYWRKLGRGLAQLHLQTGPAFGFFHICEDGSRKPLDCFCGLTPQPNPYTENGHTFFAEQRLRYQGRLALGRGLIDRDDIRSIEDLCERLPELVPPQPPSLIHGDLWVGNVHVAPGGEPALIDPAAHWGWAEAEIAMTRLFGGFPQDFYDAYLEARPLDPGWESRVDVYNLYHVLNHINLFGGAYVSQARGILRRYA